VNGRVMLCSLTQPQRVDVTGGQRNALQLLTMGRERRIPCATQVLGILAEHVPHRLRCRINKIPSPSNCNVNIRDRLPHPLQRPLKLVVG